MPPNQTSDNPPSASPPSLPPAALEMLEPGEKMITVIRRHPIGIILIYLELFIAVVAILAVLLLAAPGVFNPQKEETRRLLLGGSLLGVSLLVLVLLIATYVYRQSRLVVTDRSVIQIFQKALFIRTISRLSMSNVEDVTASQRGILANLFNYGTLTIQTAGTMDNFIFPTCPTPNKYAHVILEARQAYAQSLEEEQHRALEGRPL